MEGWSGQEREAGWEGFGLYGRDAASTGRQAGKRLKRPVGVRTVWEWLGFAGKDGTVMAGCGADSSGMDGEAGEVRNDAVRNGEV